MKINNLNPVSVKQVNHSKKNEKSYLNTNSFDSFEFSTKIPSKIKSSGINFSGILNFSPKHVVFTNPYTMPTLIQQGANCMLPNNKYVELPSNFGDIVIGRQLVLDLTSEPFQNMFKNMKNGQEVILGRNNFDKADETISRQHIKFIKDGGKIYAQDCSTNGTKFIANGKYKNYSKDYLKQTYSNIIDFTSIIDGKYNSIRRAQYSPTDTLRENEFTIQKAIWSDPVKGYSSKNGYWMYRIVPERYPGRNIVERMSLNAVAHPGLLYELDELIANGRYTDKEGRLHRLTNLDNVKVEYKVPCEPINWTKRHDTVTIYSGNKMSQDFINGVCAIGEKYQRKNISNMPLSGAIQEKPYAAIEEEPNAKRVSELVDQAFRIDRNLGYSVQDYLFKKENGETKRYLDIFGKY